MKPKTQSTPAKGNEKLLLHADDKSIDFQRTLLCQLTQKLTDLIGAFNRLDLGIDFDLTDIDKLGSGRIPALTFVRDKVLPTIENPTIAGRRTTPEKVFAMMDIDLSSFTPVYNEINDFINNEVRLAGVRELKHSIRSEFFVIKDGTVTLNEEGVEDWIDTNCKIFVQNDIQLNIYTKVKALADALNEIRRVGNSSVRAVEVLQRNPRFFTSDWMGRLVIYDDSGVFKVNHNFITAH